MHAKRWYTSDRGTSTQAHTANAYIHTFESLKSSVLFHRSLLSRHLIKKKQQTRLLSPSISVKPQLTSVKHVEEYVEEYVRRIRRMRRMRRMRRIRRIRISVKWCRHRKNPPPRISRRGPRISSHSAPESCASPSQSGGIAWSAACVTGTLQAPLRSTQIRSLA